MSQFGVSIQITKLFFDREKTIRAMNSATRRAMSKAGAFIRTAARSSIKTRSYKTSAPPGQPPFDHTGFALARVNRQRKKQGLQKIKASMSGVGLHTKGLRTILFGYDDARQALVVGPVRFGGNRGTATAAQVQEFGGEVRGPRGRQIRVAPHPFMRPALNKELPNLPARWKSGVSK